MSLRITQWEEEGSTVPILRIEGALTRSHIDLLEQACEALRTQNDERIILDVSGVTFLDFESAEIIRKRIKNGELTLRGCGLFTSEILEGPNGDPPGRTGKSRNIKGNCVD